MDDGVGTDRRCALGIAMSDTSPDDMRAGEGKGGAGVRGRAQDREVA